MDEKRKIIFTQETEEDQVYSLSLRPSSVGEFVGQHDVINNLCVSIEAAKQRGEPIEHMLFSGPPGLGKTSLANIVAHEMDYGYLRTGD